LINVKWKNASLVPCNPGGFVIKTFSNYPFPTSSADEGGADEAVAVSLNPEDDGSERERGRKKKRERERERGVVVEHARYLSKWRTSRRREKEGKLGNNHYLPRRVWRFPTQEEGEYDL
jgi:hypothetical protein